jgi:PAS domain S-box-containing protein
LAEGTQDAAFAVDGLGRIVAWNHAAEALFGLSAQDAVGQACGQIVQGMDECGMVCSEDCSIQHAVRKHHPVGNFDLQVQSAQGRQWCNLSVLIADDADSTWPYSIHIVRPIDVSKRLELAMRDFIRAETGLPSEQLTQIVSSTRTPVRETDLTKREIEVLRLLAKGATTTAIAAKLHISRTTVNNHIQHVLRKLGAHTRLEAIRRAEHAGLI